MSGIEEHDCAKCQGYGYIKGHNPLDPHEYGCSDCPIQVPCEQCRSTGKITIFYK